MIFYRHSKMQIYRGRYEITPLRKKIRKQGCVYAHIIVHKIHPFKNSESVIGFRYKSFRYKAIKYYIKLKAYVVI